MKTISKDSLSSTEAQLCFGVPRENPLSYASTHPPCSVDFYNQRQTSEEDPAELK